MATPSLQDLRVLSPLEWVKEERRRQQAKWGEQNHNAFKWFTIFAEEFGEVAQVLEQRTEHRLSPDEYTRELEYELLQCAAVCVAWVEAIRRADKAYDGPTCVCEACAADRLKEAGK